MSNKRILRIQENVLNTFYNFRQKSFLREAGGILLGNVKEHLLNIEKATIPGKGDKQGLFFFHRQKKRAQQLINESFLQSKGTLVYLGEWHTHRQQNPCPSYIDKKEIIRAYKKSKLNVDIIVLIIVGNLDRLGNIWVGFFDGTEFNVCVPLNDGRANDRAENSVESNIDIDPTH